MARLDRAADFDARKKARVLRRAVYAFSRDGAFGRNFALRDEIRRSALTLYLKRSEFRGAKFKLDKSKGLNP